MTTIRTWEFVPVIVIDNASSLQWDILKSGQWVTQINDFDGVMHISPRIFQEKATEQYVRGYAVKGGYPIDECHAVLDDLHSLVSCHSLAILKQGEIRVFKSDA